MIRLRVMLAVLVLTSSLRLAPAAAVTYGDFVDSPQLQYPEVVPVWVAGGLCTGTLIEQQIVLTAAHCVYDKSGPIQVAVGGSTLNSGRLIDVTATWYHPRYDAGFLQNDIALLHLKEASNVAQLASLPSPKAKNPKTFTMVGWGDDQNGRLTGNLSALNLNDQGSVALKAFRGTYNPRTMIGAGKFFASEDLYGGGCEGDSGGPLYKGRNGTTRVVVGVTSWGAEGCVQYKPTIFTSVSYYVPELLSAITQVKNRAAQNPRRTGPATQPGFGPTTTTTLRPTTTTTSTTTTTTLRPTTTTTSTTTTVRATTTTRVVTSLSISVSHRITNSSDPSSTDPTAVELVIQISTDAAALPTRLCVYLNHPQGGLYYQVWGGSDWSGDGAKRCVQFVGQKDTSGTYYYVPKIGEILGEQRWSVAVDIADTLGRFKTSQWYYWTS